MIEAIVRQELLLGSRRTRLHVFRWIYAGWLIVQVCWFGILFQMIERERYNNFRTAQMMGQMMGNEFHFASSVSVIGGWFCETFILQQLILLLLAVPPLVAGAIADEKRRGTLIYLLTTDLDTRHILLGKLIGRMIQVLALMSAGLPLFALFAGFAGVYPLPLLLLLLVLIPPLFALAAASILASVVCRQTRDAVIALYVVGGIGFGIAWLVPGLAAVFDPRWVISPVWAGSGEAALSLFGQRFLIFLAIWATIGLVSIALALALLRPLYREELENTSGHRVTWYAGERARMTHNPVAWRERHVEGLSPFAAFKRMPLWLACALVSLATTISSIAILVAAMPAGVSAGDFLRAVLTVNFERLAALLPGADIGFLAQSIVVLLVATFIVGVRTSGAVTGERERFTWEALLLTPLTEGDLIRGKLWGVLSSSSWYLLAYAAPALSLSVLGGMMAFLWTLLWLAVTLLAMYFIGAAGLWASVRSSSSWRSLLSTMGFGYFGGVLIFIVTSPLIAILAAILMAVLSAMDIMLGTHMGIAAARGVTSYWTHFFVATCIGLAVIFFVAANLFLRNANTWIATRERTRHWEEDEDDRPYRRTRRRALPRSLASRWSEPD
jgi:ABC-type transport system involved in multi-copper enzyme maturation permease subunit